MDGTSFPERSDSITKTKWIVFINTQKHLHGGSPMNLSFTYAKYFYSKYYCGRPVASADGATGEGRGCSLSGWMTFGLVGGGMTFASDPGSTPSVGWVTST